MALDPSDFAVRIPIHYTNYNWEVFMHWAAANGVELHIAYGNAYFRKEEDAIMFRLKFNV